MNQHQHGCCSMFHILRFFICRTLNPALPSGRVYGLQGIHHLSSARALHSGLGDWVSTLEPRRLSSNKLDQLLLTDVLKLL